MAGENDGGTQAAAQQQTSGQADAQQQQQAGQAQQTGAGVGKHTKTDSDGNPVVNDNGGASEGKHAADGAYQAAIKQRDAKIAELEAQIAKAAETKETADKLTAEIADLKQQSADYRFGLPSCRRFSKHAEPEMTRPRPYIGEGTAEGSSARQRERGTEWISKT